MTLESQRRVHLCVVAVLLSVATLSAVACAVIFGKFYNLNRTLGYPDITDALSDALDNNSTDLGATITLTAGSAASPAFYVVYVVLMLLQTMKYVIMQYGRTTSTIVNIF
jgi:hypothetical protein